MYTEKRLAHINEDGTREQTLKEHLEGTAELAGMFADSFRARQPATCIALMHDIGKNTDAFQRRLHGGPRVDHSTAGAKELDKARSLSNHLAAYCVAGHHSGLPDGGTVADTAGLPTLSGRLKKELNDYSGFEDLVDCNGKVEDPNLKFLDGKIGFTAAFYTRMLFSCLVDADFLDTERFMNDETVERSTGESIDVLLEKLEHHVGPWLKNTEADTVNGHRTEILRACMEKGGSEPGLYTLTVPTGGGKTVSSLAFALRHAVANDLDRIIYVIPFQNIIEQTAAVFSDIIGKDNVLEDHSNVFIEDPDEFRKQQLAAENYDKPVIVTTNVQFFESLFSNRSSKCRKLHNLAKSVIIFDEAQMLPAEYLLPCVRAIAELVGNYGSTAVICTATQPAIIDFFPQEIAVKTIELCPNKGSQYEFFKRTVIENIGEVSEQEIVSRMMQKDQALCILNRRKSVRRIFEQINENDDGSAFHLSTWMYPNHRREVLKMIRERLRHDQPCRVVATSLIEAGVDVDFPYVLREIAGTDSIIQAGGRCNREGRHPAEECHTDFFTLLGDEIGKLPAEIRLPVEVTKIIAEKNEDISTPDAIEKYFRELYKFKDDGGLDTKDIIGRFNNVKKDLNIPFESVAKIFKLIETPTKNILIPREEEAREIADILRTGNFSREIMRRAGVYSVSVYEGDFKKLYDAGRIELIFEDFAVLLYDSMYTEECGLIMEVNDGQCLFG